MIFSSFRSKKHAKYSFENPVAVFLDVALALFRENSPKRQTNDRPYIAFNPRVRSERKVVVFADTVLNRAIFFDDN